MVIRQNADLLQEADVDPHAIQAIQFVYICKNVFRMKITLPSEVMYVYYAIPGIGTVSSTSFREPSERGVMEHLNGRGLLLTNRMYQRQDFAQNRVIAIPNNAMSEFRFHFNLISIRILGFRKIESR